MTDNLNTLSLPKWPQLRLRGSKITEEQVIEYAVKTDSFFDYPSYNNRAYSNYLARKWGLAEKMFSISKDGFIDFRVSDEEKNKEMSAQRIVFTNIMGRSDINMGDLPTSMIMSSWIGGRHSLVDWEGNVEYHANIGKWPSVDGISDSFVSLAKSMPFLHFEAVIMDREESEEGALPVCGFAVSDGVVEVIDIKDFDKNLTRLADNFYPSSDNGILGFMNRMAEQGNARSEVYIPQHMEDKVTSYLRGKGWEV